MAKSGSMDAPMLRHCDGVDVDWEHEDAGYGFFRAVFPNGSYELWHPGFLIETIAPNPFGGNWRIREKSSGVIDRGSAIQGIRRRGKKWLLVPSRDGWTWREVTK